jgi:hypothetical protein
MLRKVAVAAIVMSLLPQRAQALERNDLLALVAMPLAVAAVSEITDVPANELMDVVALLNDAAVPPPQFIEVVRYVPVALVTEVEGPTFIEYLRARESEGMRGAQLVTSIQDRFRVYDLGDLEIVTPRVVEVDDAFIPAVVRTRVADARAHPHGGPPGQLKKQIGARTGAEIVHGTKPGKQLKPAKPAKKQGKHEGHGKGKGKGKG